MVQRLGGRLSKKREPLMDIAHDGLFLSERILFELIDEWDSQYIFMTIYYRKKGEVLTNYAAPDENVISEQGGVICKTCCFIEDFGVLILPSPTSDCIFECCPFHKEWIHFYLLNDGVLKWYQATSRGANRVSELPILIPGVLIMGRSDTIAGAD